MKLMFSNTTLGDEILFPGEIIKADDFAFCVHNLVSNYISMIVFLKTCHIGFYGTFKKPRAVGTRGTRGNQ